MQDEIQYCRLSINQPLPLLNRKVISTAAISENCGANAYARGQEYFEQRRVLHLEPIYENSRSVELTASVIGNGRQPYRQQIQLSWKNTPASLTINGTCTCPVAYNCKHVVAACLAYREQTAQPAAATGNTPCFSWLETLNPPAPVTDFHTDFIAYTIIPMSYKKEYAVRLTVTRLKKQQTGMTVGKKLTLDNLRYYAYRPHYARPEDDELTRLLAGLDHDYQYEKILTGYLGHLFLQNALSTGRLFWKTHQSLPLEAGEDRNLLLDWQHTKGSYRLQLAIEPKALIVPVQPPLYLDVDNNLMGAIDTGNLTAEQFTTLLGMPSVPEHHVEEFSRRLVIDYPHFPLPPPKPVDIRELADIDPRPHLRLLGRPGHGDRYIHYLMLQFDYAENTLAAIPCTEVSIVKSSQGVIRIHRNSEREQQAVQRLLTLGFHPAEFSDTKELLLYSPSDRTIMDSAGRWADFLQKDLPKLEQEGWLVEQDASFLLQFQQAEDWEAAFEPADNDWFAMRFNIDIEGRKLPLLPLLMPVLENYDSENLPDILSVPLDDHQYLSFPSSRLKPFLAVLHELFDKLQFDADGRSKISRFDAAAVADLEQHHYGIFSITGGNELIETGKKIKNFQGIADTPPPPGLRAQLRTYQQSGVNWLQFLREFGFAGILADDMGLGKTIQTLAHLLIEKQSGRLQQPCLIIAPTSLMSNWRREAQRFTPQLSVLTLQGEQRKQRFTDIAGHDLVLTTYPLLPRDRDLILQQTYYYLILDEAQFIKNPKAQASKIVRLINTRHRLCLTGTPMENHLGELWAQFDFLLPGFLGDQAQFKKVYRTPIEVHGDADKSARLSKRLKPFLLRRSKTEVAAELPEKTEIIRSVPLYEKQAALYESIRISMEKKVRDAIKLKGLARSHITILEALLKLRQTCCDPRTLALQEAQKITQSAKLDLLMEMLPELLAEGRRVLIFSQFTRMLGLIEAELSGRQIGYTKLTGQTKKREEAIEKFKDGRVDVFLISLKAGGVGLNLTEADTVIIYDPWWNPAVENQAADRAHRIGQDKAVFVYKLLTEQTVEEKILSLQEKKRALADSVYQGDGREQALQLTADDLADLFTPIQT